MKKTPTRTAFLEAYEWTLRELYGWAREPEKLARFMESVRTTVNTDKTVANLLNSDGAQAAYRSIGCKGKLTYRALRALPE